jgi:uncharacterized protein (DUF486 family)
MRFGITTWMAMISMKFIWFQTDLNTMRNMLYIIAVILIISWAIAFLGYNLGGLIHILLALAIISILLRVIKGKD